MSISKHTPGPWAVGKVMLGLIEIDDVIGRNLAVIEISNCNDGTVVYCGKSEAEKNAALIAAAPDLLQELDACRGMLVAMMTGPRGITDDDIRHRIVRSECAIAAAGGNPR
jgi:hypothetical protein